MRVDDRWLEISTSLATLVSLMNKLKVDENALRVDERDGWKIVTRAYGLTLRKI
jgi:hypothetical protein